MAVGRAARLDDRFLLVRVGATATAAVARIVMIVQEGRAKADPEHKKKEYGSYLRSHHTSDLNSRG